MSMPVESCTFITFKPVEDGAWFVKDFKTNELRPAEKDTYELAADEPIGLVANARILNGIARNIYMIMNLEHGEDATKIDVEQATGEVVVKTELRPSGRVAFFYETISVFRFYREMKQSRLRE